MQAKTVRFPSESNFRFIAIVNPIVSHFLLLCANCDQEHQRPCDSVVQLSLCVCSIILSSSCLIGLASMGSGSFRFWTSWMMRAPDSTRIPAAAQEIKEASRHICAAMFRG
ncbi:unnamed protein product [Linum trigynum]|uniref:Uncharacterized protein n=1 Tax=Linum trigynum TaxID=586398 RepID=A0AAV2F8L5_9ROSI